jgi:hypothetical protein
MARRRRPLSVEEQERRKAQLERIKTGIGLGFTLGQVIWKALDTTGKEWAYENKHTEIEMVHMLAGRREYGKARNLLAKDLGITREDLDDLIEDERERRDIA